MFFLLRCAFWLGLVFLAMARDAGALPFVIESSAPRVEAIPAMASQALAKECAAAPRVCAKALARAAALVDPGVERSGSTRQSLEAADYSPPWRGKAYGG